jgi:hypothetical protein
MVRALTGFVLLMIVGYGVSKAWSLLEGPSLTIVSPLDHESFPSGVVTVTGKASRIAALSLDGASLLHDIDGNFSSTLTFPKGGSILTFVATDRFGRRITTSRSLFVPN